MWLFPGFNKCMQHVYTMLFKSTMIFFSILLLSSSTLVHLPCWLVPTRWRWTSEWLQTDFTASSPRCRVTSQYWGEEVDTVQFLKYPFIHSSNWCKNSCAAIESPLASGLFFAAVCRIGSAVIWKASRINKLVFKKSLAVTARRQ